VMKPMKKFAFYAAAAALTLCLSPRITAQAPSDAMNYVETEADTPDLAPPKTPELPPDDLNGPNDFNGMNGNKLFPLFSQGLSAAWLTRIINQTDRSNFVFRDFLPGLYFEVEIHILKYLTPALRAAVYYPLVSSFNLMPQKPKNPLHVGADFFAGLLFEKEIFQFMIVNGGLGLHLLFLNSDRWNYLGMGAAVFAGLEFLLNSRWSLLVEGFASLDNGNMGENRIMEPIDIAYQYQVDLGFRYSKKREQGAVRREQ